MATASDRGWGFPTKDDLVLVPCAGIPLRLRKEVAPLFAELIRRVEAIKGVGWMTSSGGNNFRPVRGYEDEYENLLNRNLKAAAEELLSNHSWALAADFRAATNGMRDYLKTDMPSNFLQILAEISPHFEWGGSYKGRKDPMHVEYMGTPAQAAADVARLRGNDDFLEGLMAQLNEGEKNEFMELVRCLNRTFNERQQSKVDPKSKIWLAEGIMFGEASLSRIAGFMERLVKQAGA